MVDGQDYNKHLRSITIRNGKVAAPVGGSIAIAFFISSSVPFIGWIFIGLAVIALFALTAWIEKNKDNKVQEWLQRCHFGVHADKYKTEAEEASELQKAFA